MSRHTLPGSILIFAMLLHAACGDDAAEGREQDEIRGRRDAGGESRDAGGESSRDASTSPPSDVPKATPVSPVPEVGCDTTPSESSSCGGVECPDPPQVDAPSCGFVVCCTTDDRCGSRSTVTLNGRLASEYCVPTGTPDPNCPDVKIGPTTVPGCCDAQGRCGSLLAGTCTSVPDAGVCDGDAGG